MCKININQELNGIELSFESKPEAATLDEIKSHGFRWNRNKCVWYAKQTVDRLTFAESLGEIEATTKHDDKINLDNLGENTPRLGGAELSSAIRDDLKRRGVKGCTVRVRNWDSVTVTVRATAADFTSLEEFKERYLFSEFCCDIESHGKFTGESWVYSLEGLTEDEQNRLYDNYCKYEIENRRDYNEYHRERKLYPQYTTAFCEKLEAIYKISNQWNYDNSDPYTDYFDRGYYLDIDIKAPEGMTARETMTDEERNAYYLETEKAAAEYAARLAQYEEERRQAEEESRRYEAQRKEDETIIYNNIRVEDLEESERYFIKGLLQGGGKECNLEELRREADRDSIPALITRKIIFDNESIFETFGKYLLNDWVFVAGKGGTASEDVRLDNVSYYDLNEEQRKTVEFYNNDCIAVYVGDSLRLVVNPEGYNYCRYCMIPNNPEIIPASEELERMRTDSV